ncbi:MAG: tetratricopeptide repeat protein [Candidatus Eremiobacteraeota bacterium]|nr:tetratricopeptide repeat protein [Candidatus Eremiobacteraeota bacterium]
MSDNIQSMFEAAVAKDKSGEGSEAMRLLDTILEYQPGHRMGRFYRGGIRIRYRKDPEGGVRDWEEAFEGAPAGAAGKVRELYPLFLDSCYERLIQFTSQEPDNAVYHSAFGRACLVLSQVELAERHLQRALSLDKTRGIDAVRVYEALKLLNKGEIGVQIMQKHLEHAAESAELQAALGLHYRSQAMTAQALKHLEASAKLSPRTVAVRQALGEIYLAQGRMDQAESHFQFMLQNQPTASAHLGMAECDKQQFRFAEALENFQKAATLEPQNFQVLADLGDLALQMGEQDLGIRSLKSALALEPNHPEIYGLLAKAALQKGDRAEAIQALTTQLRLDPNDAFAAYTLATQWRAAGQYQEAGQLLSKALAAKPGDVQISLDLAECYEKLNYPAEARKMLREAYERNPTHQELQAALARLDPEALVKNQAPQVRPEVEEWVNLARAHAQGGRHQEAFETFRKVLGVNPHHAEALSEIGRIYAGRRVLAPAGEFLLRGYASDPSQLPVLLEFFEVLNQMVGREAYGLLDQLARCLPQDLEKVAWLDYLWRQRESPGVGKLLSALLEAVKKTYPPNHPVAQRWVSLQLSER